MSVARWSTAATATVDTCPRTGSSTRSISSSCRTGFTYRNRFRHECSNRGSRSNTTVHAVLSSDSHNATPPGRSRNAVSKRGLSAAVPATDARSR